MSRSSLFLCTLALFAMGCAPDGEAPVERELAPQMRGPAGPEKPAADRDLDIRHLQSRAKRPAGVQRLMGGQEGEPVWTGADEGDGTAVDADLDDGLAPAPPEAGDTGDTGL